VVARKTLGAVSFYPFSIATETSTEPSRLPNRMNRPVADRRPLWPLLVIAMLMTSCDSPIAPVPVASVEIIAPAGTLVVGETMQAAAIVRDARGNELAGRPIEWSSSDDLTATVSASGLITAVAAGPVTITARSEGQAGHLVLSILPVPVASVTVSPDTATLEIGDTRQLTATLRDAAGAVLTGRTVVWTSSDETIARVAEDGLVSAVAEGAATITATSEGRSGGAAVTVLPLPPADLNPPAGVRVERRSRLRAHVAWEASEGAVEYRVDRRLAGDVWTAVATTIALSFLDETERLRGAHYEYRVTAIGAGVSSPPSGVVSTVVPAIRLALIGDSNLERGKSGTSTVATSYVSGTTLSIDPEAYPDHPKLMSGKIMAFRADVEAVNHGISSTRTGTGTVSGRPDALHSINGVTRFEAEVLGKGYPWTAASIPRVNAFTPTPVDYGYYALGVNDISSGISPETIRDNIGTAIDMWLAAGLPPEHLMVATIGPRLGNTYAHNIPATNQLIRALVAAKGVSLVDIAALVSDDDGLTWKSDDLHTGDGLHYTEATLDLIAAEVSALMGDAP
jgi:hypothetical protein